MRTSELLRAAGVMAATGVLGLAVTQTATASTSAPARPDSRFSTTYQGVQGQLDTHPGDGAASWVWAYSSVNGGRVEYQFYDNSVNSVYVNSGQTSATEPDRAVWRIRACVNNSCGSWT